MTTTYPISAAYADGQVLSASNVNQIAGGVNDLAALQLNAQTGTTYTLVLGDAAKTVTLTNASAITLSVPTNASVAFAIGTQILLYQGGAGQVTVSAVTPATTSIRSQGTRTKITGQYAVACLMKLAADEWVLFGNISA
jgi:DNA-binding IclR family transcriptional regulator